MRKSFKAIIKFFLIKTLKLAGWKLWVAMYIIDTLYKMFIRPLIREEKTRIKFREKEIARKILYDTISSKVTSKDHKSLAKSLKKAIKNRKDLKKVKEAFYG